MKNAFLLNRRQTERFAQLLDERHGGPRHHVRTERDPELAALLPIVDGLTTAVGPAANTSADFKRDLHAMLMATIEREGIGATSTAQVTEEATRPTRGRRIRFAGIIGLAAGTLAVSSMSMASGDANPGDALYGMKRSTEKAQLALAGTEGSRGQLYLQFARTRMAEALTVAQEPDALAAVLNDMDSETKQGVRLLTSSAMDRKDPAALDSVEGFVTGQRKGMTDLLTKVTGDRGRASASLALLDDVQKRSTSLRSTMNCLPADSSSVLDDLGPIPQRCGPAGRGDTESTPRPGGTIPSNSVQPSSIPSGQATPGVTPSGGLLGDLPLVGNPSPTPQPPNSNGQGQKKEDDGLLGGVGKILSGIFG